MDITARLHCYFKIAAAFHKQTGLLGRRNRQLCFKKKTDFVLPGMIRFPFGVCFKFACDDYNTYNVRNADVVGYIFQSQKNFWSCCCVDCYKC